MKRIWQIEEQTIEDPTTNLRLEFSSVHTDEVNAGNEAPRHDNMVVLRLWTSERNRVATFTFERNGKFVSAEIEAVPGPADVVDVQPGGQVAVELEKPGETSFVEPSPDDPLGLPNRMEW